MKNTYLGLILALLTLTTVSAQGIISSQMTTMEMFLREEVLHEDMEMKARFVPGIEEGKASYYADRYHGLITASGERFDTAAMTCAHRDYPFGALLKVTRVDNNKFVVVRVNDRGPFVATRIVDLSKQPARQLGMLREGTIQVRVEPVAPNSVPSDNPSPPTPPEPTAMGKGFFSIAENKYPASGFGVQTGSYADSKTLFLNIDILKQKGISPLMVHSGTSNNNPVFRIIIGPFKNKKEAANMVTTLKAAGVDGVVVDMKGLK